MFMLRYSPGGALGTTILATLLVTLGWLAVAGASAPAPFSHERFRIAAAAPASSSPPLQFQNASPLEFGYFLQDLLDRAAAADKGQNQPAAIRYYRAVTSAVPDRAVGFSRLCPVLQAPGQREPPIASPPPALGFPPLAPHPSLPFSPL